MVAASALVFALKWAIGSAVVQALTPAFRAVYSGIDADVRVIDMRVVRKGAGEALSMRVDLAREIRINGYVLQPLGRQLGAGGWYEVTLTVGGVLQSALMTLVVVLAWPAASMRAMALRIALAMPLCLGVVLLNTPMALSANLWRPFLDELGPNTLTPLVAWDRLMEGGGRLLIGVLLGCAVVRWQTGREDPRRERAG